MRTVNFGGGNVTVTDPSSGGSDLFVLKLNSSGEFQWVSISSGGIGKSETIPISQTVKNHKSALINLSLFG